MPIDIGDVGLTTRIMLRNRSGRPRSWTRANMLAPSAAECAEAADPAKRRPAGQVGAGGQQRGAGGQAAEEQVGRDVRLPWRRP